ATRCMKWLVGRFSPYIGAPPIRNQEAGFARNDSGIDIGRNGEIEPVAKLVVFRPFEIAAKNIETGFGLDDPDAYNRIESDDVGASSRGQREFAKRRKTGRAQMATYPLLYHRGGFGLASVGRHQRQERVHRGRLLLSGCSSS